MARYEDYNIYYKKVDLLMSDLSGSVEVTSILAKITVMRLTEMNFPSKGLPSNSIHVDG
jgi:hypothetical protein